MRHLPERNTCHPIPSTVTPSTIIVYVTWCLFSHINLTQYQPEKRGHRIFLREYARWFGRKERSWERFTNDDFFFFFLQRYRKIKFQIFARRIVVVNVRDKKWCIRDRGPSWITWKVWNGHPRRNPRSALEILMFATISRSVSLWPSRRCSSSIRLPVNRYRLSFCTAPFVRRVLASVIHHRYGTITIFCRPITRSFPDKGEQKRRRGWWPP